MRPFTFGIRLLCPRKSTALREHCRSDWQRTTMLAPRDRWQPPIAKHLLTRALSLRLVKSGNARVPVIRLFCYSEAPPRLTRRSDWQRTASQSAVIRLTCRAEGRGRLVLPTGKEGQVFRPVIRLTCNSEALTAKDLSIRLAKSGKSFASSYPSLPAGRRDKANAFSF